MIVIPANEENFVFIHFLSKLPCYLCLNVLLKSKYSSLNSDCSAAGLSVIVASQLTDIYFAGHNLTKS